MPNVLVLGGRAPVALDHARRFSHQGWKVFVADSIPCQISGASRTVDSVVRIASPRYAPTRFVEDLQRAVASCSLDLILPTCEEVFYVSRYRHHLPSSVRVLADDFAKLRQIHSKWNFLQLAEGCGIGVPASARVTTIDEARAWAGSRPVVLKPEFSRFGVHVRLYRNGIPPDAAPLVSLGNWVVQEYVAGREFCSYSVADRGKLVAHSLYYPRWRMFGSSSFYFEAARIDAIRSFVAQFSRKLDFTGQLSFDWIESVSGDVFVLECNPRATSGCHLFSLDDSLPATLAGTSTFCVEPVTGSPRMIGAVMLTMGLFDAIRQGRLMDWWRDYRAATDVIAEPGDCAPVFGAVGDLVSYAKLALQHGCSMREAATKDIEWDGEELPDT